MVQNNQTTLRYNKIRIIADSRIKKIKILDCKKSIKWK